MCSYQHGQARLCSCPCAECQWGQHCCSLDCRQTHAYVFCLELGFGGDTYSCSGDLDFPLDRASLALVPYCRHAPRHCPSYHVTSGTESGHFTFSSWRHCIGAAPNMLRYGFVLPKFSSRECSVLVSFTLSAGECMSSPQGSSSDGSQSLPRRTSIQAMSCGDHVGGSLSRFFLVMPACPPRWLLPNPWPLCQSNL